MIKTRLRTEETYARYQAERKPDIHSLPVKEEWVHWKLVENEYPYDNVFDKHDMLILKGEALSLLEIDDEERAELAGILAMIDSEYDCLLWAFTHSMTYPTTLHVHLLHTKEVYDGEQDLQT